MEELAVLVKVNTYFSNIDREATIGNAKAVLEDYEHRKRRALRFSFALKSPKFDGMPRSEAQGNPLEDSIVNHVSDQTYVTTCEDVINAIQDQVQRQILWYTYIKPLADNDAIMDKVNLSYAQFYREKNEALLTFAEIFPPLPSDLIVKK